MTPIEDLTLALAMTLRTITIVWTLYITSKIYRNIIEAHKKHIHNSVEYKGCTIYPEKVEY